MLFQRLSDLKRIQLDFIFLGLIILAPLFASLQLTILRFLDCLCLRRMHFPMVRLILRLFFLAFLLFESRLLKNAIDLFFRPKIGVVIKNKNITFTL